MKTVCLIPARGGSQRIPGKNIRIFHGKPIIYYSIKAAQDSGLFDEIVVSTDSEEISEVAQKYGASVYIRSAAMSRDEVGTQEVAKDFLEHASDDIEYLCVLYPCAPMVDVEDFDGAFDMLEADMKMLYAMTVGENPLHDAGQFYFGTADAFLRGIPLIGTRTRMIPVPPERDIDINVMDDWHKAVQMFEALHEEEL